MRRIVVTGLGFVSPLGCGSELAWSRLLSARSGLTALPEWAAVLPARVAGIVPTKVDDVDGGFDPDLVVPPKDQRRMDRFILFALTAASEAIAQAAWTPSDAHSMERTATVIASGIGGFPAIVEAVRTTDQRGVRRLSPFTVPSFLANQELEHAIRRGAKPLAEIVGYGTTADAYHITSGPEDGDGARRAMQGALRQAGLKPGDIQHLNAHSTSTPVGDVSELEAIKAVFGRDGKIAVSATKSATGHLLGAAGGADAIITALALCYTVAPPTLNLYDGDVA